MDSVSFSLQDCTLRTHAGHLTFIVDTIVLTEHFFVNLTLSKFDSRIVVFQRLEKFVFACGCSIVDPKLV
jgi:hypothetical protein